MRRAIFWLGWSVLAILPLVFVAQIVIADNLPEVELWQWCIPIIAVLMIVGSRNRDEVLKHRVV